MRQAVPLERQLQHAQAQTDFYKWQMHFLPHHYPIPSSSFHRDMDRELTTLHKIRGVKRVIEAPRGSAKSTRLSFAYPMFAAVEGLEPYTEIISDTITQSCLWLETIKTEIEENEALREAYPMLQQPPKVWRETRIVLPNNTCIEALGTGSKIRGRKFGQHRPTLIVLDDPENEEHFNSERRQERVWRWFTRGLLSAGSPQTNVLVAGTAIHAKAIVERLKTMPGWKHSLYKSIVKWPDRMDLWGTWETILHDLDREDREGDALRYYEANKALMNAGAVVLWPERESLYTLMMMRALSHLAFEYEKQNNPISLENVEFPADYFDRPGFWFDRWPKDLLFYVIALDPSKGRESQSGDYAAFVILGVDPSGRLYVDADIARRPISSILDAAFALQLRHQPIRFAIETNQFQELLIPMMREKEEQYSTVIPYEPINNRLPKEIRIRRVEPYLQRGAIRFMRNSPSCTLLVDQLKAFPNGEHDDGPDALDMAIQTAYKVLGGN